MDENKFRCPKCQHEQTEQLECEACGLIFARYNQFQQKQKEKEELLQAGQQQKNKGRLLQTALLVCLTASVTYYFSRGKTESSQPGPDTTETQAVETIRQPIPDTTPSIQPPKTAKSNDAPAVLQGSPLEHARNATVSIETPWGVGSGFFVKENYVVTNKHVVEIDKNELAEFSNKVKTGRELIRLEQEKIKDMYRQKDRLPDGPSKRQLDLLITKFEEDLAKNLPQFEKAEEQLKKMKRELQPGDIKIIMADGSETTANYLTVSSNQDLALISLYSSVKSFLKSPARNMEMQPGEKVYTIGSPVGLRHTVTSGIFSGYRKREPDGAIFLQTDAAINPGNSGGPLIDEKGNVHGVNTMIIKDTEGIGFAIPIETVYEEFRLTN
jgi:serine protease Do